MTPDDISIPTPPQETGGKPKMDRQGSRSVGPESETRGGQEAPDEILEAPRRRTKQRITARAGIAASDPPFPPGQPPVLPDPGPEKPPPIEEPPRPLPVPPNDPPPPIVALSAEASMQGG
jgi:hypothetical protein